MPDLFNSFGEHSFAGIFSVKMPGTNTGSGMEKFDILTLYCEIAIFLPRGARILARYLLSSCVCLSVHHKPVL